MSINIEDYPKLSKALSEVIDVPSDKLETFDVFRVYKTEISWLLEEYHSDTDGDERFSVLSDADVLSDIAENTKGHLLHGIVDRCYLKRIYEIAQEMGPIMEEIERVNNEEDRINE